MHTQRFFLRQYITRQMFTNHIHEMKLIYKTKRKGEYKDIQYRIPCAGVQKQKHLMAKSAEVQLKLQIVPLYL